MSAPSGPASISVLQLPSPSVIVGDVMRDSLGNPAPLSVIAYDANGTPVSGVSARFFITDTTTAAQLGSDNLLTGVRVGVVRIVGQVGNLQTPAMSIPITHAPAKIGISGKIDTLFVPLGGDTAVHRATANISASVRSSADSGSQGIIVRYTLVRAPTPLDPNRPAAFLTDEQSIRSLVDTTDGAGTATRRLVVVAPLLGDKDVVGGTKPDSAIVEVRATYKGVALSGSPVRFVVPIKVGLKL
jgi:hypothetical protein